MKFEDLKSNYEQLFQKCEINADRIEIANTIVDRILANEERYRKAQNKSNVPWAVIGIIHSLESSLNFNTHLHNGDPLSRKTVQVPKDRPPGNPPFTWEESAADALSLENLNLWQEWTIPGTLFVLERYNGAGYNKRGMASPYLWSFSNNYKKGKFVKDGKFDPEAVSQQCGGAVLLKILLDRKVDLGLVTTSLVANIETNHIIETVELDENPKYPGRVIKIGENDRAVVRPLQLKLNELGCGNLQGSGFFGNNTEEAVKVFQARFTDTDGRPLEIDGEVGSITWAALFGIETVPKQEEAATKLIQKALQVAVSQIGIMEKPLGSNRGTEVEGYLRSVGLGGGNPWCMAFIYWCYEQAAKQTITNPLFKTGHVLTHWVEAGRRNIPRITTDQANNNPGLIQPGMIFIIDTGTPGGAGHTGLVEKVVGGRLTTIEGNTNVGGAREGIGVFRREARKIVSINKGFIDYSSF